MAFKSWQVLIMGFTMILVGTAITGFVPLHMGFKPAAFGIGMAVFAACPTSLSQGVTVVIQVGHRSKRLLHDMEDAVPRPSHAYSCFPL